MRMTECLNGKSCGGLPLVVSPPPFTCRISGGSDRWLPFDVLWRSSDVASEPQSPLTETSRPSEVSIAPEPSRFGFATDAMASRDNTS